MLLFTAYFLNKALAQALEGFGKLWELITPYSKTWEGFEKGSFSNWLWKSFGFLFGKILQYPKMDIN